MQFNVPENRKPAFKLALLSVGIAVVVIVLGAFTRLVDAGLGCPDWPGCYGHLMWPETLAEIRTANQNYPASPVEMDKTWPEMVHRYFASGLGLLIIIVLVISLKHRENGQPVILPVFLLGFVILQGLFGMWTVTLKLWPQVVTAHLLGGFTTLSLLWLLVLRLNNSVWEMPSLAYARIVSLRPFAVLGLLIVVAQIALGGWTTSNYAAVACPDLPVCQGLWWPVMNFTEGFDFFQTIGPNYLGGKLDNAARTAIHFSHRVGAIITFIYLLGLIVVLIKNVRTPETNRVAWIMLSVLILQLCLGLGNIYFHFPIVVAVAHNAVGAALLLTLVTLTFSLYTVKLR